jgi:hypothetical protein
MQSSKEMFLDEQQKQAAAPNELSVTPSVKLANVLPTIRDIDATTIDTLARALVNEVAEGNRSGVDLFTQAVKLSLFADTVRENVKGYVYGKTLCEKGATFTFNGVELSPAELGVSYDYSSCGSSKWKELKAIADAAKKDLEDYQKYLKSIKGKVITVNEETGEVETIFEPVKSGQSGYKTRTL